MVLAVRDLIAVRIGPSQLLVLAQVIPRDGADIVAGIAEVRRTLLAIRAVVRVEITPIGPEA